MSLPQPLTQHAATRTPRGATIRNDYGKTVIGVLVASTLALTACGSSDENTESGSAIVLGRGIQGQVREALEGRDGA